MNDLISRRAAIDAVLDRMDVEKYGRDAKRDEIKWTLEKLPSAEPQWIPCSEGLPEERLRPGYKDTMSDEVLATFESLDGERFVQRASFTKGELFFQDQQRANARSKVNKSRLIAWMPFPEPYKG